MTKINKATKTAYGYKKYGGDKRSYVPVANTSNDNRCSLATKINNSCSSCPLANTISATGKKRDITMTCACGVQFSKTYEGIFNEYDAINDFCDYHREVM
jgi:hypothetical protein